MDASHTTIADLIGRTKRTIRQLADDAGISHTTICTAKSTNTWPAQERPRLALARVLGLTHDPMAQDDEVEAAGGGTHAADATGSGAA